MSLRLVERTAAGRGAVRVLVLAGSGALERVRALAGTDGLRPGRLAVARIGRDAAGRVLDEALVVPLSEAEVELHLTGSPAVVGAVTRLLGLPLERVPRPAEELPLEEAARVLLARAPGEAAARVLLDQAEGSLRRAVEALDPADRPRFLAAVERLLARWPVARRLLSPPVVVIAGPTNAGKSTLFNALVGEERVVASEEPGTTRDLVRERAALGAWVVEWVDTAGERAPVGEQGGIEAAGQALARSLRSRADLVLWLARDPDERAPEGTLGVTTCADLLAPERRDRLPRAVSAGTDPAGSRDRIEAVVRDALGLVEEPWEPGRAVPFLAAQVEHLAAARDAAAAGADAGALRARLSPLLGR